MLMTDDKVLECFRLRLADRKRWTLEALGGHFGANHVYIGMILRGESRTAACPDHPDRLRCVAAERESSGRRRRQRKRMPAALDRAVALYRDGFNLRAAAARCRISRNRLWEELVERGVPLRPVGRPRSRR